jgi:peptide deformylase
MPTADLKLRYFPDSILRKKAAKIADISDREKRLIDDMAKAMYLNQGVGLAAVQVGIDKQVAVIDTGSGLIKMINPVIVTREGITTEEEGCLSVPEVRVKVKRAKKVVVNFINEKGDLVQLKAEGLLARAIQHEVDHLSGMLIIDYLNPIKKLFVKKRLSGRRSSRPSD